MSSRDHTADSTKLYNSDVERALLGSLISEPAGFIEIRDVLSPDDFGIAGHRWVYEAICSIEGDARTVDAVTICEDLKRRRLLRRIGGEGYVAALRTDACPSGGARSYADIIRDYSIRRQLLNVASETQLVATNMSTDAYDGVAYVEKLVTSIQSHGSQLITAAEVADQIHGLVTEWAQDPLVNGETRGLSTGISPLDRAIGGLRPGLYLVAARPSMGKTALCLQLAANIASRGQRVLFFSLEMGEGTLGLRILSSHARVTKDELERGELSGEQLGKINEQLSSMRQWSLSFQVRSYLRARDVRAVVQREQKREPVAAVFVDGLWLMASAQDKQNRNLELGAISRELKLTAETLEVPIVAVHQLSRSLEKRANKRPLMSDLRESGHLEEDADLVLMLHREGYYAEARYEPDEGRSGIAEIWVKKDRIGGTAGRCVELYWESDYAWFAELTGARETS